MYDRLFVQVCGMFNPLHVFTIVLFFAILALALCFSRRLTEKQVSKFLPWITILISVLEVIKIVSRIQQGYGPDSWVPLYFCSLFIFASWLSLSKNDKIMRTGFAYMTMGGIVASVFFTFYPSTSLGMYPIMHLSTFHSFLYHLVMCYTGIVILWKGGYVPQKKDALYYFLFVFAACVLAVILNKTIGTNCMFLSNPFGLPALQMILEMSEPLYMLMVSIAQASGLFWADYGLYCLLRRLFKRQKSAELV